MAGKFMVIEGTDGSGKATQTGLLVERLKQEGRRVEVVDFPRYNEPSSHFAQKFLNGDYGSLAEVSPQKASLFFAMDRFDASFEMRKWLADGALVISNRYVASNMGHQGSKIQDLAARRDFFKWIHELEYETLGIPKPDMNIFLHVPSDIAYELVSKKGDRAYLKGNKRDIAESDINHFYNAEATYKEIIELFPDEFCQVECAPEGALLSPEAIAARIWESVQKYI
jgi:dTMP kinase